MTDNMLQFNVGVRGEFDVYTKREGEEPVLRYSGPNLITNTGMDRLMDGSGLSAFCAYLQVGTGNTAPAYTDTSLVNRIASQQAPSVGNAGTYVGPTLWSWDATNPNTAVLTRTFTFSTGAATGNLAELGLSQTETGTLSTRALFVDGSNNPITITVLADEQLIVTYRLYFTPSTSDSTLVTTQKGTSYTLTWRPANLSTQFGSATDTSYGGARVSWLLGFSHGSGAVYPEIAARASGIALATSAPTGSTLATNTPDSGDMTNTYGAYTAGQYYRDDTMVFGLARMNVSGIQSIHFKTGCPFQSQIGISPALTKTSSDKLSFTVRTTLTRA